MPTNRLCEEIVQKLKIKMLSKEGLEYWRYPEDLFPDMKLKRDLFLKKEVYFADGINENECDWFDKIINRYRENWIKKRDICKECKKQQRCRFVSHLKKAPLSRIVVTTHAQYDHFCQQQDINKWFKYGYDRSDEAVPRDMFIVDEDLVLSKCYQPICLYPDEVGAFCGTVTAFLERYENTQEIRDKIHSPESSIELIFPLITY